MTKAKRQMQEDLKLIDLIIELVDARIPLSSRNPDIDELGKNKARLILLNKSDLADERYNEQWSAYFQKKGFYVVKVNAKSGAGLKSIQGVIQEACKAKIERDRRRGIKNRPIRAMVVGIPNVGKSTFINSYAGKACAKTGNKPGVTKGKQWIRLNKTLELLDYGEDEPDEDTEDAEEDGVFFFEVMEGLIAKNKAVTADMEAVLAELDSAFEPFRHNENHE